MVNVCVALSEEHRRRESLTEPLDRKRFSRTRNLLKSHLVRRAQAFARGIPENQREGFLDVVTKKLYAEILTTIIRGSTTARHRCEYALASEHLLSPVVQVGFDPDAAIYDLVLQFFRTQGFRASSIRSPLHIAFFLEWSPSA